MVGYLPPLPGTDKGKGKRFPTQQLICMDKLVRFRLPGIWTEWGGGCQSSGNIWLKSPCQGYLEQGWGSHACWGGGKKGQMQLEETESRGHMVSWERAGSGLDSQLPSSVLVSSQTWLHALPWFLRVTAISFQKSLLFVQWYLNQKTCSHFWGTEF